MIGVGLHIVKGRGAASSISSSCLEPSNYIGQGLARRAITNSASTKPPDSMSQPPHDDSSPTQPAVGLWICQAERHARTGVVGPHGLSAAFLAGGLFQGPAGHGHEQCRLQLALGQLAVFLGDQPDALGEPVAQRESPFAPLP